MDNVVITPHLGASTVEAQIGVSVDVAEGVMEALKGEPVATAVNMAPVPPNVYNVIHPYFDLMERMGNLAVYLADAPMKEIEVEYTGELADTETRLLTTAVLKGASIRSSRNRSTTSMPPKSPRRATLPSKKSTASPMAISSTPSLSGPHQ